MTGYYVGKAQSGDNYFLRNLDLVNIIDTNDIYNMVYDMTKPAIDIQNIIYTISPLYILIFLSY